MSTTEPSDRQAALQLEQDRVMLAIMDESVRLRAESEALKEALRELVAAIRDDTASHLLLTSPELKAARALVGSLPQTESTKETTHG